MMAYRPSMLSMSEVRPRYVIEYVKGYLTASEVCYFL